MEIQNQVSRILRDNLARLRDVLDEATAAGVGSLVQVADGRIPDFPEQCSV